MHKILTGKYEMNYNNIYNGEGKIKKAHMIKKNKPIRYSEEYEVSGMARTYSYPRFAIGKQRKERFSFDTLRNIFPTMNFNDLVLPGIKSGKSQASFADTIALLFKTSIWPFASPPSSTIFMALQLQLIFFYSF